MLGRLLDERDERRSNQTEAEERWLRERAGIDPAERLQSWDRWLRARLQAVLTWPADEATRDRLQRQCAAEMTTLAKQLRGPGWLLDGQALAAHVDAVIAPIGKAQRTGNVGDFWPYFRAAVGRYVGANAEEIQRQAKRTNTDEGTQTIGALLSGVVGPRRDSMVELLTQRAAEVRQAKTETLRERQARLRARDAAAKADAAQPTLFGASAPDSLSNL